MTIRAAAALTPVLLAACSVPGPPPPGEVIRFQTEDGIRLEGEVRGSGPVAVVLVPGFQQSRDAWADFADFLADRGYRTLAFDFRGTGGSEGTEDVVRAPGDLSAAVAEARAHGSRHVFVVGADIGGSAALLAAPNQELPLAGIVTLSAPSSFLGLEVSSTDAAAVDEPKLFFAAEADGSAQDTAEAFYAAAPPPKRVEVLVGSDHGAEILEGREAEKVRNLILAFIAGYTEGAP